MDQDYINDLTNVFKKGICEILDIWLEIGVVNEKFVTRTNSLKIHVENLLNDMIYEENRRKAEIEKSVEILNNDIRKLCKELKIEYVYQINGSLVDKETNLLMKKSELTSIKDVRIKKFHTLLNTEDNLCMKLYEYKLNLDPDLIPTEDQLESLEYKIKELEKIKNDRMKDFVLKRNDIKKYYSLLGKGSPNDALVQSILKDEHAIDLPLSKDFLCQCDCIINQLTLEYESIVNESNQLKDRFVKLFKILYPSNTIPTCNRYLSKTCNEFSYDILTLLQREVFLLEKQKLARIGEFAKNYQFEIRELLHSNFSFYLEYDENYQKLLNAENVDESLLEKLETELDKWKQINKELEPLKVLMESWKKLFNKLTEINANLKCPIIMKNRGGILLKVEKEKNSINKEIPKCEAKIKNFLLCLGESNIGCPELRIDDKPLDEYIAFMWNQVEGDKENERKERKMKPNNPKLEISKCQNKPLQTNQQKSNKLPKPTEMRREEIFKNQSKILSKNPLQANQQKSSKLQKVTEIKREEIFKSQSKILSKKNIISPITKPTIKTNLDRRFSKSYNFLHAMSKKKEITGSTSNLYSLFCKNVKGDAVTSSFVEN